MTSEMEYLEYIIKERIDYPHMDIDIADCATMVIKHNVKTLTVSSCANDIIHIRVQELSIEALFEDGDKYETCAQLTLHNPIINRIIDAIEYCLSL